MRCWPTCRAVPYSGCSTYSQRGAEAVRQFQEPGRVNGLTPHRLSMEAEFLERPQRIVAEGCDRIERLRGVRRRLTQVRQLLRTTLRMMWRKVAAIPVPPQQSAAEHAATQAAFPKDGTGTATG